MNIKSSGPEKSHEDILADYSDMVYRLAVSRLKNKTDAEDVFQEVFLRLVKADVLFETEEHIKAWLIRVTVNCCNKLRSTAWFRRTVPLSSYQLSENQSEDGGVYYAVLELPAKYRTVIHLFYYEDMSVAQISNALNMKNSTVTSQLSRARSLLRKKLKEDYNYE